MTLVVDMFVDLICGDIKVDVVILVVERCVVVILLDATSEDDDILFVFFLLSILLNINLISKIGGFTLLVTGILILTNQLQTIGFYILRFFPFMQNFG